MAAAHLHPEQADDGPGGTLVRRFVFEDRIWTAIPTRLVAQRSDHLLLAHWPGVRCRVPQTYLDARRTGDPSLRVRLIDELVAGETASAELVWTQTTMLTALLPDEWFAVCFLFASDDQRFLGWYVNFELPYRRRGAAVDSNDQLLDLWIDADGTRQWKDEDEYDHACRVGFVSPAQARQLEGARERAVGMFDDLAGPFAAGWHDWRLDPEWPAPVLPDSWHQLDA